MGFCNPHIKEASGEGLFKGIQSGAVRHSRGNGYNIPILPALLHHGLRKDLGIAKSCTFRLILSGGQMEGTYPMVMAGGLLRRHIALSFFGDHMHQNRMIHPFRFLKHRLQGLNIVSIHRAQIGNAHVFKKHAPNKKLFDGIFGIFQTIHKTWPKDRHPGKPCRKILFEMGVILMRTNAV